MDRSRALPHRLTLTLAFAGLAFLASQALAGSSAAAAKDLRHKAAQFETAGDWDRACDSYEELLKLDAKQADDQDRYRYCLRRINQIRRHRDASYQKQVLSLTYPQAIRLFEEITRTLLHVALEKDRIEPGLLFRKGLEEFKHALNDAQFQQTYLRGHKPADLQAFRAYLAKHENLGPITRDYAGELVREVALKGLRMLRLNATVSVMEFACGACHAIDDYTVYLTPSQIHELNAVLEGQIVGVGLKLALSDGKLVISDVIPDSPAAEVQPPLARQDQVVSIDKKPAAMLTLDMALGMLEGEGGAAVELSVLGQDMELRTIFLRRRAVFQASVYYQIKEDGLAHLRITSFQESTLAELDAALLALKQAGAKGIMLDLRGNGGGIFQVAIESAKRFLASGVIVSTQNYNPNDNKVYRANNPAACNLPMAVLVDADTASAAEVLAGALKENRRARLVGQTTYGKGCSQGIVRLPVKGLLNPLPDETGLGTGGLRVTVMRFFSPSNQPYTGRGVTPHVPVTRRLDPEINDDTDQQLVAARTELQGSIHR